MSDFLEDFLKSSLSEISAKLQDVRKPLRQRKHWFTPDLDLKDRPNAYFKIVTSSQVVTRPKESTSQIYTINDFNHAWTIMSEKRFQKEQWNPEGYMSVFPRQLRNHDDFLMLIGGGVSNQVTASILEAINSPIIFREYSIYDKMRDQILKPVRNYDKQGRVEKDFALIARTENPWDTGSVVYIFAGIHSVGSLSAAYCALEKYDDMIHRSRLDF